MFKIGNDVFYGGNGVCRIREIRMENFSGEQKMYYILTPHEDMSLTIYVPVDASALTEQMRPLLTKRQIDALIAAIPEKRNDIWISDSKIRAEHFSRVLQKGDHGEMLEMLREIYQHRIKQAAQGKKLYLSDEHVFEKAEKRLYGEFAAVLNIAPDHVTDYIQAHLPQED